MKQEKLRHLWERGLERAAEEQSREQDVSEVALETAEPFKLRTNLHAGLGSWSATTPGSAAATTVQDD